MLKVLFGTRTDFIKKYDILRYPNNHIQALFEWSWLDEDWIRRELVSVERFPCGEEPRSVMFERGQTPVQLCGSTKTLLLARHTDELIDFARMGPNCYTYLMEIADMRDVRVAIERSHAEFDDAVIKGRSILIENNGVTVTTSMELFRTGVMYT